MKLGKALALLAVLAAGPKRLLDIYDIASAETATLRQPARVDVRAGITQLDYDIYKDYPGNDVVVEYVNCAFNNVLHISGHPFSLRDMKKDTLYLDPNVDGYVDTTYAGFKSAGYKIDVIIPCSWQLGFVRPGWFADALSARRAD